jgi:hypothetical protein
MRTALLRSALLASALLGAATPAWAQGGSARSTLSGTVLDTGGGVLPGATVVVRNVATSVETTAATNSTGVFDVPALDAGRYTVTVSLDGFECAPPDLFVEGPIFTRFDLNIKKRFGLPRSRSFELGVDVMNLFNAINFNAVAQASNNATLNQVTSSYQDPNVTFDPGGRLMQLVFRFNF